MTAAPVPPASSPHPPANPLDPLCLLNPKIAEELQRVEPLTYARSGRSKTATSPRANHKPLAERFWCKVAVGAPDACWPWMGSRTRTGYGQFKVGCKPRPAHRIAWELTHGPIRGGLHLLHFCDNTPCCNPGHLSLGTHAANMADMARKGRTARGEGNGSAKLTGKAVCEIRRAWEQGGTTQGALGRRYGVTGALVGLIVNGRQWTHLACEDADAPWQWPHGRAQRASARGGALRSSGESAHSEPAECPQRGRAAPP